MRVAYISAGAAGMYCGSCLHDNTLVAALQRRGVEVALVPTYTPLRTDERNVSMGRLFYGGINVYLQQKIPLFRHTPRCFDWLLDRPALLRRLARFGLSTDAGKLGALTLSVLRGEEGSQRKELARLVRWLKEEYRPDLVHLTNSLFAGFARRMKQALGVPVLCALQGEDLFLERLGEPHRTQALAQLKQRSGDVDAFVAPCHFYAEYMAAYLGVAKEKIHVVELGINLRGYGRRAPLQGPPVLGYMARIAPEKGLHLLVEAFVHLKEQGARDLRLEVAGYLGRGEGPYFEALVRQLEHRGLGRDFHYWGEVDREAKIDFLARLHLLSVPATHREAKGLFALEALASGVPVVLPRHGALAELIAATGGGILVETHSSRALARGIRRLLEDEALRRRLGEEGREAVRCAFSDAAMAEKTLAVYRQYA